MIVHVRGANGLHVSPTKKPLSCNFQKISSISRNVDDSNSILQSPLDIRWIWVRPHGPGENLLRRDALTLIFFPV